MTIILIIPILAIAGLLIGVFALKNSVEYDSNSPFMKGDPGYKIKS